MLANAYSPHKALRHLDVIQSVKRGEPVKPVHVQLIIANACSLRCQFCAYRLQGYTSAEKFDAKNMMPTEKALEILDDCYLMGVRGCQYTGGGSPTVHPDFARILDYSYELGIKNSLVSNGINIHKKGLAKQVATQCSWVRISLDAGNEQTYNKTKGAKPSDWQAACSAIRELRQARDAAKSECVIGVGFVVTPYNWGEIPNAALLAHELGADNIRISAMFNPEDEKPFLPFFDRASVLSKTAEALTGDGFTVYNRFGDRLSDLKLKRPDYPICGYQHMTAYIGADQNLYRCCVYSYNKRGLVASLRDRRFKDVWMSAERVENMQTFNPHDCERCQFNGINRMLAYVLSNEPQLHEEFV